MKCFDFDPDVKLKKELWCDVYSSVIDGLFLNNKCNGIENIEAKTIADKAVRNFEETFKTEEEDE